MDIKREITPLMITFKEKKVMNSNSLMFIHEVLFMQNIELWEKFYGKYNKTEKVNAPAKG